MTGASTDLTRPSDRGPSARDFDSLKAMRPDITRWKCERRANITCPVTYYWFVMVGTNY